MDYALIVRVFESIDQLFNNRQRLVLAQRARERPAVHEFEDNGVFFHAINRGDVRVIQRGEELGFALKSGQAVCIERKRIRQDFDRASRPSLVSLAR